MAPAMAVANFQKSRMPEAPAPPAASFEGSPNPMLGLGVKPVPAGTPDTTPLFVAQDTNPQKQVPINFSAGPAANPVPLSGMPQYGWGPRDTEDGSHKRMKRDIRPVSMEGAPSDYADAWRGTSLQQSMQPQTQPASFPSMSAAPIRVVAPQAAPSPQTDLRPAQGYS